MEKTAYPIIKDPEQMPRMQPRVQPQQVPIQMITQQREDLELKIHWAQVWNVIMLVATGLYFYTQTEYYFKHMEWFFGFFMVVINSLIILNIIWYFNKNNQTLSFILIHLAYLTFILEAGSLLAVVATISLAENVLFEAILAFVFVNGPGALLGWSTWIVVRNHLRKEDPAHYYAMHQNSLDQESLTMTKSSLQQPLRLVPVMIDENRGPQIFQTITQ